MRLVVLTLIVVFCLVGRPTYVRLASLTVARVFVSFDIVFLVDATRSWEYCLGVFYIAFNLMIIWYASTWPKAESDLNPSQLAEHLGKHEAPFGVKGCCQWSGLGPKRDELRVGRSRWLSGGKADESAETPCPSWLRGEA